MHAKFCNLQKHICARTKITHKIGGERIKIYINIFLKGGEKITKKVNYKIYCKMARGGDDE
jgi:hypothetical protein